jgi:hypothetical protein
MLHCGGHVISLKDARQLRDARKTFLPIRNSRSHFTLAELHQRNYFYGRVSSQSCPNYGNIALAQGAFH